MIKARISHVDLAERHAQESTGVVCQHVIEEKPESPRAQSVASIEAQLLVCSDAEARGILVETLKAQVDASSYHIDSTSLAQKMQGLFVAHATQKPERDETPGVKVDG